MTEMEAATLQAWIEAARRDADGASDDSDDESE